MPGARSIYLLIRQAEMITIFWQLLLTTSTPMAASLLSQLLHILLSRTPANARPGLYAESFNALGS